MGFLTDDLAQTLVITGILLLAVEILVLGFATFFLCFVALGCIATGLLFYSAIIAPSPLAAFIGVAVFSALSALFLWRPLQKMQRTKAPKAVTSDLVGHRFVMAQTLEAGVSMDYHYSGIRWQLSSRDSLVQGMEVEVIEVSVGRMRVAAVTD